MKKLPYTFTANTMSVFVNMRLHNIPDKHPGYAALRAYLTDPENKIHDVDYIVGLLDKRGLISRLTAGAVTVCDNDVFYKGAPVRSTLTEKLILMLDSGEDAMPWARFLDNMMQNPNPKSRDCLYNFLESHATPLTEDGCFIAWKYVNSDYTSAHRTPDGKVVNNKPGTRVTMKRELCNSNPNETCSRGLHVCASEYLGGYDRQDKIICVKVNPRDVVAVPTDYSFQKMRCCAYDVIGDAKSDKHIAEVNETLVVRDTGAANQNRAEVPEELAGAPICRTASEFEVYWERNAVFPTVDEGSFVAQHGSCLVGVVEEYESGETEPEMMEDADGEWVDDEDTILEFVQYKIVWQDGVTQEVYLEDGEYDPVFCVRRVNGSVWPSEKVDPPEDAANETKASASKGTSVLHSGIKTYTSGALLSLVEEYGQRETSRRTGVPRSTLQGWIYGIKSNEMALEPIFVHDASNTEVTASHLKARVQEIGQRAYSRETGVPRSTLQGWLASL